MRALQIAKCAFREIWRSLSPLFCTNRSCNRSVLRWRMVVQRVSWTPHRPYTKLEFIYLHNVVEENSIYRHRRLISPCERVTFPTEDKLVMQTFLDDSCSLLAVTDEAGRTSEATTSLQRQVLFSHHIITYLNLAAASCPIALVLRGSPCGCRRRRQKAASLRRMLPYPCRSKMLSATKAVFTTKKVQAKMRADVSMNELASR